MQLRTKIIFVVFFILVNTLLHAQIDAKLTLEINQNVLAVDEQTNLSITIENAGIIPITGMKIMIEIPSSLAVDATNFTPPIGTTFDSMTGLWGFNDVQVFPSTQLTLQLSVTALTEGIHMITAEVYETNEIDINSMPNNQSLIENDYASNCISTPIGIHPLRNDTITVAPTANATANAQWIRVTDQGTETFSNEPTLITSQAGTYYYTSELEACEVGLCCGIIIEERDHCEAFWQPICNDNGTPEITKA